MAKTEVQVQIEPEMLALIDERAASKQVSRSETIRRMLAYALTATDSGATLTVNMTTATTYTL